MHGGPSGFRKLSHLNPHKSKTYPFLPPPACPDLLRISSAYSSPLILCLQTMLRLQEPSWWRPVSSPLSLASETGLFGLGYLIRCHSPVSHIEKQFIFNNFWWFDLTCVICFLIWVLVEFVGRTRKLPSLVFVIW